MQDLQLFAWQAAARGNDVHLNANPTQGELLHYEFKAKKEELKDTTKSSILAKYGGAEYLDSASKELRQGQTENYVEYSRTGSVIKGREKAKARSKYPEDGMSCNFVFSFRNMSANSLLDSLRQQPYGSMGLLVRHDDRLLGIRVLSLVTASLVLRRAGRN